MGVSVRGRGSATEEDTSRTLIVGMAHWTVVKHDELTLVVCTWYDRTPPGSLSIP
jgi:hypothetical protein